MDADVTTMSSAPRQGLSLYRTILRLHRQKLPEVMRGLGDDYVRCVLLPPPSALMARWWASVGPICLFAFAHACNHRTMCIAASL